MRLATTTNFRRLAFSRRSKCLTLYNVILLLDMLRRGANSLISIALVLVGTNAASIHFHARPHVFTLLFLTLAAALIARDRVQPTRWIWSLVPLTVLWANMHGVFVVLLIVLALAAVGSACEANRKMAIRYGLLTVTCGLASLLNPQGIQLHLHILELMGSTWYKTGVNEFQSPSFASEPMYFFMALLFLGLMTVYALLRRRSITEALWILFFAYWSLVSVRNVPLFIIVALPYIAVELTRVWREFADTSSPQSTMGVLNDIAAQTSRKFRPVGLWTAAFVIGVLVLTPANRWPADLSKEMFPLGMLHRHAVELAQSRVFTMDQWADYLIYQGFPRQRVFMDGRSDFYGEQIRNDYLAMTEGRRNWRELLARYSFDRVLCPPDWPLVSLLKTSADWRIADQDSESVLFVKN